MHSNRRNLVAGLAASAALGRSALAVALEQCPANDSPPGTCSAYIDPIKFQSQQVASTQEHTQWCWAASISMICQFHGHKLSQTSIVKQMYGTLVNMPADDKLLTEALNREWITEDGKEISISAKVFSPTLNKSDVLNKNVVEDLRNEQPLLNGSGSHATVLARVDYYPNPSGQPLVVRAHVIDPWPSATANPQRARFLDAQEMMAVQLGGSLRYLASVKITES